MIISGSIYMFYGLFNYPIFSKRCTDSYLTSGMFFNYIGLMFAGSYLGFNIKSLHSTEFIKSPINVRIMTIPLVFSFLGILNFYFLDNLDSLHIVPFIIG